MPAAVSVPVRSVARARLVAAFSYFETPEILGGEGDEFSLVLDDASARLKAAWRCKTWGEFARLSGLTWTEFVKERAEELLEILDRNEPRAATPLVFGEIWGQYSIGDVPDPRTCAYDYLTENVPGKVLDNPRLQGLLEWGGSSPGGNIDLVTSRSALGFMLLQEVLHRAGFVGLTLRRSKKNPLGFLN